jgi:lysophospholipase L1-like esterase
MILGVFSFLIASAAMSAPSQAGQVYLALGDSVSFGYDPSTLSTLTPSYGDQGFVASFADALGRANGGVRPEVVNLAIVGEVSDSFFTASAPSDWVRYWQLNAHYTDETTSQNDLMLATIAQIHGAGNTVSDVSLLMGANDIFSLINTAAFQTASPVDQQAMVIAAMANVQSNYLTVLTELKAQAPEARIFLPDYYNPYPAGTAGHDLYDPIALAFRQLIEADAAAFGATVVDLYDPFTGHELAWTNIATGDVHPTQAGYQAIGAEMAAAIPEPTTVTLWLLGGFGLAGGTLVRRRRSAA